MPCDLVFDVLHRLLPSTKARRSALKLKPPYRLYQFRLGVDGIELYFPSGKAQVHHCCL